MTSAERKHISLVYAVQRQKAAEPRVVLPTARQSSGVAREIPTKRQFPLLTSFGYSGASPHQRAAPRLGLLFFAQILPDRISRLSRFDAEPFSTDY